MAAITQRSSLDNAESNIQINLANQLSQSFDKLSLSIVEAQTQFGQKVKDFHDHDPSAPKRPNDVARDVAMQLSFLRKLKFHYLEQHAKDKYVKIIVNDDASLITADDNDALRRSNEAKKAKLKVAKDRLAAKHEEIRTLAPEVEQNYLEAKARVDEASTLAQQIIDARLALSRLRSKHHYPRLTVATATATLDSQTEQMTHCDSQLSDLGEQLESVKRKVQDGARELEHLRSRRAEKEMEMNKQQHENKGEKEDGRIVGLYEWFTASLALHRELFSVRSVEPVSENELALTYNIDRPPRPRSRTEAGAASTCSVTLTLLFHPNTRQLADAHLQCPEIPRLLDDVDMEDTVGAHAQANDVPGLIRALLARLGAQGH